jgi:8-oxo-dGTP pyrophosphatase MutT (NUDIX family)
LIKKSPGLFGAGKWSVLGGKMNIGESPEQSCIREVFEESGLHVNNLKYHGVLEFWFGTTGDSEWVVHAFSADSFQGRITESHEGILRWIEIEKIPYEEMWADNKHWFPLILEGKIFHGRFWFNKEGTKLLEHQINAKNTKAIKKDI